MQLGRQLTAILSCGKPASDVVRDADLREWGGCLSLMWRLQIGCSSPSRCLPRLVVDDVDRLHCGGAFGVGTDHGCRLLELWRQRQTLFEASLFDRLPLDILGGQVTRWASIDTDRFDS